MSSKYKYSLLFVSIFSLVMGIWFVSAKSPDFSYLEEARDESFIIEMIVDTPPKEGDPFQLDDPPNIEEEIVYDPINKRYTINRSIGGKSLGPPEFLTFDEYVKRQFEDNQRHYWKDKLNTSSSLNRRGKSPLVLPKNDKEGWNASDFIQITPNGSIDITLGGNYQNIDNPILTQDFRKQGQFNFDMNIQANVVGNIGDLMKLNFNYNTKATFEYENQMKLAYNGKEDQIIRKIEAGNISLPLKNSLIQGSQNLFGLKTELQFGRLTVTSLISQQKSKNESIQIQGGAQTRDFRVEVDNYDYNKHYFLSHFFRDNYEKALANSPTR